jgi:hypothetical protein
MSTETGKRQRNVNPSPRGAADTIDSLSRPDRDRGLRPARVPLRAAPSGAPAGPAPCQGQQRLIEALLDLTRSQCRRRGRDGSNSG